ncbi:peroxisomal catalase 1-like [Leguminivora glycinivorella]|uniref:peroxisomal catalase 1-like n=1 Tax=Leguminivora glycinivorella TaxID=1035111 RepID=UPI00200EE726|nr:peroxisomal catalase 1-like [Leguminivora glycinivorella]
MRWPVVLVCVAIANNAYGIEYLNVTLDAVQRQLEDFKLRHPKPIGVLTTSAGSPVDVRETVTLNTDFFNSQYFWDLQTSIDNERIPQRVVHARGTGAFGYFEVTNDVSKYTKADVFNGIGKRTPAFVRFSYLIQGRDGLDVVRETGALVSKFYTNDGNLDFLSLSFPVFLYNSPHLLHPLNHAFKRNPKTYVIDSTARLDAISHTPEAIHQILWLLSDFGIFNGYRHMNAFPIHAYEIVNKHGDSYFVRFNFISEQGLELLSERAAVALRSNDPDYSNRDLYDAIAAGNYPSWRLDIDIIPKAHITKLNYNPFDMGALWRNGTYHTVTIGRLVLNKNPDNNFKDSELAAFNPGNLVPGIPGPVDDMFKARRFSYRDAQAHRLGINHNNIEVNLPKYAKTYNRDGVPPVLDNMKDAPNYYQNLFNGPVPFVDVARPKESPMIKFRQSTDLGESAYFYNTYVNTEGKRTRLATNIAGIMVNAVEEAQKEWLRIMYLVDRDLGARVEAALPLAEAQKILSRPRLVLVEENPKTYDLVPNCQ